MAKPFNVDPGVKTPPNFNISTKPTAVPSPDFTGIFKGIGSVIENTVSVMDTNNQKAIEDKVRAEAEVSADIVTNGGVSYETAVNAPADSVPPDLEKATTRLGVLKQAYDQGKINEAAYWARLNAVAKELRVKFPGYDSVIDSKFSSITGRVPANALRDQLLNDAAAAARDKTDAQKEQMRFIDAASKDGHLPPNWEKMITEPGGYEYIKRYVYRFRERDAITERNQKEIALRAATNTESAEETMNLVRSTLDNETNHIIRNTFETVTGPQGASVPGMFAQMAKAKDPASPGGSAITPEELQTMQAAMASFKQAALGRLNQVMYGMPKDGTGSFSSRMKPEQAKAVVDEYAKRLDMYEDMVLNNQTGILAWNKNLLDMMANGDKVAFLQNDEFARHFNKLKEVFGNESVDWLIKNNTQRFNDSTTFRQGVAPVIKSGAEGRPLAKSFTDENMKPESNRVALELVKQAITMPNADPRFKERVLMSAFGPENAGFVKMFGASGQAAEVFTKLTTPDVTQAVVDTKDPKIISNYANWVQNSAAVVLSNSATRTMVEAETSNLFKMDWNPDSMQFDVAMPKMGDAGYEDLNKRTKFTEVKTAVDRVNALVKTVADVAKATGADPKMAVSEMLRSGNVGRVEPGDTDLKELLDLSISKAQKRAQASEEGGGNNTKVPFGRNVNGVSYTDESDWSRVGTSMRELVNPKLVTAIDTVQNAVDFPIKVVSAARYGRMSSQHHPVNADGKGNALDISLKGLTDAQRTDLVRQFVKAGVNRIGAYSGNTGLHIDMKAQRMESGAPWPMFDKSINNMHRAPEWFRDGLELGWYESMNRHDMPQEVPGRIPTPKPNPNEPPPPILPPVPGDKRASRKREEGILERSVKVEDDFETFFNKIKEERSKENFEAMKEENPGKSDEWIKSIIKEGESEFNKRYREHYKSIYSARQTIKAADKLGTKGFKEFNDEVFHPKSEALEKPLPDIYPSETKEEEERRKELDYLDDWDKRRIK